VVKDNLLRVFQITTPSSLVVWLKSLRLPTLGCHTFICSDFVKPPYQVSWWFRISISYGKIGISFRLKELAVINTTLLIRAIISSRAMLVAIHGCKMWLNREETALSERFLSRTNPVFTSAIHNSAIFIDHD